MSPSDRTSVLAQLSRATGDYALSVKNLELTLDFAELLASAGPWGQGMPEPVFEGEFEVMSERVVGETHLKLILAADTRVDAIGFGMATDGCAPGWRRIRVVFRLGVNEFRNQLSTQLLLEHVEPV